MCVAFSTIFLTRENLFSRTPSIILHPLKITLLPPINGHLHALVSRFTFFINAHRVARHFLAGNIMSTLLVTPKYIGNKGFHAVWVAGYIVYTHALCNIILSHSTCFQCHHDPAALESQNSLLLCNPPQVLQSIAYQNLKYDDLIFEILLKNCRQSRKHFISAK